MNEEMQLEIVRMRDEENLSWNKIGNALNISASKAKYWYDKFITADEEYEKQEAISKMLESHNNKLKEKEIKESAMYSIIADRLSEKTKPYNNDNFDIEIKIPEKNGESDREIVVHLTDFHLGKKGKIYNKEIAIHSLKKLYSEIVLTFQWLKILGFNVISIKIMLGGDIVDGDLLYPGHPNFVDMNVYEQISVGFNELRDMIISLRNNCKIPLDIYHVYGNHGRISKFTTPTNNWDNILYMFLKTNLENLDGINMHDGFHWFTLVPMLDGENALLTHGDGINMYQNIPMYGYVQAAMRWRGSIGDFKYSYIGHFHSPYFMRWNDMQLFINGQFPTDDDWAKKVVKLQNPPMQWLQVFSPKGIESQKLVQLI